MVEFDNQIKTVTEGADFSWKTKIIVIYFSIFARVNVGRHHNNSIRQRQTDRQTDTQTDRQRDIQTNRQPTHRQTGGQAERQKMSK